MTTGTSAHAPDEEDATAEDTAAAADRYTRMREQMFGGEAFHARQSLDQVLPGAQRRPARG